jgi:D-3-phosphoglycerate dehydrogenase
LTEAEVTALIEEYQPLAMIAGIEPLNRPTLNAAKFLKVISRCGIGLDSVDLHAAGDLGIAVTNTPDAPTIPVAELTITVILCLLRQNYISHESIRRGTWQRPMGTLLHGKTAGVVGCGRIGTYVARLLSNFGCRVLGYDITSHKSDWFENTDLSVVLKDSDIVTLHLTYSEDNHHFMSRERIALMKEGAFLINTARGSLVDEEALYDALTSGRLAGAALDCFEEEPYHGPLKDLENVLLSAHIGSYAKEARVLMERQAAENLLRELTKIGVIV